MVISPALDFNSLDSDVSCNWVEGNKRIPKENPHIMRRRKLMLYLIFLFLILITYLIFVENRY